MIWKCTCRYCPEQYDIYGVNGKRIAYFRIRHGNLYVHPYKNEEIDFESTIYEKHYNDDRGWLDKREITEIKRIVNFKIYWYLIKQWLKRIF